MRPRVHRFDSRMIRDQARLEQLLDGLEGDVVAIVPTVTLHGLWVQKVDFLSVVERLPER